MSRIKRVEDYIKRAFLDTGDAHDYYHMMRVYKLALKINEAEQGNEEVVAISALLHDVADHKFLKEGENEKEKLKEVLEELEIVGELGRKVEEIILNLSYKGGTNKYEYGHIEGKIVRDADRLDSIGAIGIARAFSYGGSKGRSIHNPEETPEEYSDFKQYKNSNGTTINHFYEKLLKIKDTLATDKAIEIAKKKHEYMEGFLKEFLNEWNG